MTSAESVRASRAGDRYHYFWASQRALRLLDFNSDLELLSIEGARNGQALPADEIIDVGEYYGGNDLASCRLFRVVQLKHSTLRRDVPITGSELETTLSKFADVYRSAQADGRHTKLQFVIVTNRKLNSRVRTTMTELAEGTVVPSQAREAQLLRRYMGFRTDRSSETDFCARLTIEDGSHDIEDLRRLLGQELQQYLPGGGFGSEMSELMEKVASLASAESSTQTLTRDDVLLVLRTHEDGLFPAMSKLEDPAGPVRTRDVVEITERLRDGNTGKLLLTAIGGMGKSVLASILKTELSSGADDVVIVFDCFARGDYRRVTSKRHPHHVAFTQIANEVASQGLCGPLIPSPVADERQYALTFMRKIRQAAARLSLTNPRSMLTVIIDAADNAVIAAQEFGERHFVTDLFREEWPANTRLVALCRPERAESLDLPAGVPTQALTGFDQAATFLHLKSHFPQATVAQADQLHELSARNPRVQAMAMERAESADAAIAALELATQRPGNALDALLAQQIAVIAEQGHLRQEELAHLCQALATLHPAIPLDVLAKIAGVPVDAIRSFAVELGRGLYLQTDTIQFRDEPTETWFRTQYGADLEDRRDFARRIAPLAEGSPYVAGMLPQLLFEADLLEDLVRLALLDSQLPGLATDLQRKEIAQARARFALAAALRTGRNADAAVLAVRTGDLSSGQARRLKMYRSHSDLAARFLPRVVVEDLCTGRELATDWPGSNLHVEASLLSHLPGTHEVARSRLRSAIGNIEAILRLSDEERQRLGEDIDADVVADLALAIMNLDGPQQTAAFMMRWRPSQFVRDVANTLVRRLADAGRFIEISELIVHTPRPYVRLVAAEVLYDHGISPSDEALARLIRLMRERKSPFKSANPDYAPRLTRRRLDLRGVLWSVLHGVRRSLITAEDGADILDVHLPPHLPDSVGEGFEGPATSTIVAYTLKARLRGHDLRTEDVASPGLLKQMSDTLVSTRDSRTFQTNIVPLLPWADCLVDVLIGDPTDSVFGNLAGLATRALPLVQSREIPLVRFNGTADLVVRVLAALPETDSDAPLKGWLIAASREYSASRTAVVRLAAHVPRLRDLSVQIATAGHDIVQEERTDSDTRVDQLIRLARAVFVASQSEARALFSAADYEAELVGDDLYARWYALTTTAQALTGPDQPARAYRLFQIGEKIDDETEWADSESFASAMCSLHPLSYYGAISRSRDRRKLRFDSLVTPLITRGAFNERFPSTSMPTRRTPQPGQSTDYAGIGRLALYAFHPQVSRQQLVWDLDPATAETASKVFADFDRTERHASDLPREPSHGVPSAGARYSVGVRQPEDGLEAQLSGLDFTTPEAWNVALTRRGSSQSRDIIPLVCSRHLTDLPDVLRALCSAPSSDRFDLLRAAEFAANPSLCATPSLGTRTALRELAFAFATRFARTLMTTSYEHRELSEIATLCGVDGRDLLVAAIAELGRFAADLTHQEYFGLAAHLSEVLDQKDTSRLFDALAALFDDLAPPETSSDGPFSMLAETPASTEAGLAGLLWTALGDTAMSRRWQAAHAVLLLVQLGAEDTLQNLALYADGTHPAGSFGDARFQPYVLHSRMWLLLALERCAHEARSGLLHPFVPWLSELVRGPSHAANQFLAQNILRTLSDSGAVALEPRHEEALNIDLHPELVELPWRARQERPDVLANRHARIGQEQSQYPFFFDFQTYWARDLARSFGSTEQSVAAVAADIASQLTGYDKRSDGSDARHEARIFRESTYADYHNWPKVEDFGFYSAVHALLTLGAELAQTKPALKETDGDDTYASWLNEFLTSRRDGRWLSDRRDTAPQPAPEHDLTRPDQEKDWRWSAAPLDFERVAGHATDWITVHASTRTAFAQRDEDVHVASALIPHETAKAFLVALQTSPIGAHAHRLPTSDDPYTFGREDNSHPFVLTAWIDASQHPEGIDKRDERGRGIRYPPARPSSEIAETFGLLADLDMRTWSADGQEVFKSQLWQDLYSPTNGYESGTRGEILTVQADFLLALLRKVDQTLVLQVEIRRDLQRTSYQRKDDDELGYITPSTKIYLIDPEGRWTQH